MCSRYYLEHTPDTDGIIEEMNRSPLMSRFVQKEQITTGGEVRPTQVVPVIASNRSGVRTVFPMKWGFTGKTLLINARSETAATKPTFRDAWAAHRCIIPASFYFEWEHITDSQGRKKTGTKYMLRPEGTSMTWLSGLYRLEEGLPCFVILTREPVDSIRFIHDRMPLMLPESCIDTWIRPDASPETLLVSAVSSLTFYPSA